MPERLPEPEFYIQDEVIGVGMVIGRSAPMSDRPEQSKQCFGLYTHSQVRELLKEVEDGRDYWQERWRLEFRDA